MISIPIDRSIQAQETDSENQAEFSGLVDGAASIAKVTIFAGIIMVGAIIALIIYITVRGGKAAARNPERAMDLAERGVGIAAKAKGR
ncbi:hypothetical protein [uncultured Microscilla sp.]|uniref:hypothetical protein n=1 Tax=uncultured Microscilla sp. TaxID=432653 RepID=UPI002623724F|nr:hypothetical protein [uncultured Microscilla sp.]